MKKKIRSRRFIALVLMLTMMFSISTYAVTDTMTTTSVDRKVESDWNLTLSETYMGSDMYTYTATEKQVDYRRFEIVKLTVVALCMNGSNAINIVEGEYEFELSGSATATPNMNALGTGICEYYVNDSYFGCATKRITHN